MLINGRKVSVKQDEYVLEIWRATFIDSQQDCFAPLVAQIVRNLPSVWETQVQSLGQEDPLQKEMTTHSSILAWGILWTEEPGELQSMRLHRVGHK